MASPECPTLLRLRRLDRSSLDFSRRLDDVLNSQEYKECLETLQRDDLMWLVDHLERTSAGFDPTSAVSRRCMSELGAICAAEGVLPTSYALPTDVLHVSPETYASGGYGDVYQGILHGSRVRVKRVRLPHRECAHAVEMALCGSAATWRRLQHPNVVNILGFTLSPLQVVSNWMPNNLPGYVEKYPGANVIGLLTDTAKGVQYLHSCDVIHREIKGTNVLVDPAGHARIVDFGLSAIITHKNRPITSHQPEYSPPWGAPEVLMKWEYTKASDIFSFAMLMAEALNGSIPFSHLSGFNAAWAIFRGERPSRPTYPALTERSWNLMQRCWDSDPCFRPEASEVVQTLMHKASGG